MNNPFKNTDIARFAYDFISAFYAITVIYLISLFSGTIFPFDVFLYSLIFLTLNLILGIYSSHKYSNYLVKIKFLIFSIIITVFLVSFVAEFSLQLLLWTSLISPPIILSRFFVGLQHPKSSSLFANTLKSKGPVLIIGGGGYIGTHLVDLLLQSNCRVRVLDKLMYGKESLKPFLKNKNFELIKGDATNISILGDAMIDASSIVHLAGLVGDPACAVDEQLTRHSNIISTRISKELARSFGIKRFIFASSCSVYGVNDNEVNEKSQLNPVSLYAKTKIDSEKELIKSAKDDFVVTVLRFATVFGDSLRPRFDLVGNLFSAQAYKNKKITVIGPNQNRPFVHVNDLARAIVKVLFADASKVNGEIFNVGSKSLNMTILELAEKIKFITEKTLNKKVKITIDDGNVNDLRNYNVSFEKINKILGFECKTDIETGVLEIIKKFKNQKYKNFNKDIYSNIAITKKELEVFNDPKNREVLYAPLGKKNDK